MAGWGSPVRKEEVELIARYLEQNFRAEITAVGVRRESATGNSSATWKG